MVIRDASEQDLPTIKSVYDREVETGIATFDTTPPPLHYWSARLTSGAPGDRLLVAELDGRAFGFERVGVLPEVGNKFDRWIDTAFWALRL